MQIIWRYVNVWPRCISRVVLAIYWNVVRYISYNMHVALKTFRSLFDPVR